MFNVVSEHGFHCHTGITIIKL